MFFQLSLSVQQVQLALLLISVVAVDVVVAFALVAYAVAVVVAERLGVQADPGHGRHFRRYAPARDPPGRILGIGHGAARDRVRPQQAEAAAVDHQLAALVGTERVDAALGVAAAAGRFAEADLASILDHLAAGTTSVDLVIADETATTQPGTNGWAGFTTGGTR